jgi:hypothetical protein
VINNFEVFYELGFTKTSKTSLPVQDEFLECSGRKIYTKAGPPPQHGPAVALSWLPYFGVNCALVVGATGAMLQTKKNNGALDAQ